MPGDRYSAGKKRAKVRDQRGTLNTRYTKDRLEREEENRAEGNSAEARRRQQEKAEARKRLEERRKRKEQNIREAREAAATRVSYVRKPMAKRSLFSGVFLLGSLLLGSLGIYGGVVTQGQAALNSAAMGLCSIMLAVVAVWYGIISFLEEEKNYVLAKICIGIGAAVLIGWVAAIVTGLRG